MERLEERYLRWVLGVDGRVPGYMIREKLQRDKLRGIAGRRAWGCDKRLESGKGSEITRLCWEEIRERGTRERDGSSWEEERKKFFEDKGRRMAEVERD